MVVPDYYQYKFLLFGLTEASEVFIKVLPVEATHFNGQESWFAHLWMIGWQEGPLLSKCHTV